MRNDWSAIAGRPWENRGQPTTNPGDRLSVPLFAAKDASISPHFSPPDIGMGMGPKIGYP